MRVKVKTYATLRKYGPRNVPLGSSFPLEIDGKNIIDVIQALKIPLNQDIIILVNGNRITDLKTNLNDNDLVVFFPRIGGG